MFDTSAVRRATHSFLHALIVTPETELHALLTQRFAPDVRVRCAYPIGDLVGVEAFLEGFLLPLRRALPGGMRRDEIFIAGTTRMGEGDFVTALTHHVGNFERPFARVTPSGKLVFLRAGEMYRMDGETIVEATILFDLVDLMRQSGAMPLPAMLGTEMLFPGPATHDGVMPEHPERSQASAELVEAMLRDLRAFDPESYESQGQMGYWHRQMLWYGPGGIGANFTYPGFQRDHRIPFLTAFPDRVGGNHFCRFGDGDYVCSGGWPSMTMTHAGPYLGVPATGRALTLRVMDFWRCEAGSIRENWVLLDFGDLFAQMGVRLV
ncbi:nuclear transport factor 2 family protein [Salinarimonas ramus]|uniref:Polyketide cyclase n=1 Tax=Salinarimonas ramus TaxID=690164 RepID=A0A917QA57_9HYPH|nr:ester cyclase [Salinarimonas ramus]GGK37629.1 polyketide cyclase [Salinarimonas ramus]